MVGKGVRVAGSRSEGDPFKEGTSNFPMSNIGSQKMALSTRNEFKILYAIFLLLGNMLA